MRLSTLIIPPLGHPTDNARRQTRAPTPPRERRLSATRPAAAIPHIPRRQGRTIRQHGWKEKKIQRDWPPADAQRRHAHTDAAAQSTPLRRGARRTPPRVPRPRQENPSTAHARCPAAGPQAPAPACRSGKTSCAAQEEMPPLQTRAPSRAARTAPARSALSAKSRTRPQRSLPHQATPISPPIRLSAETIENRIVSR